MFKHKQNLDLCITVKAVKLKTFHYNPLYVRGGAGGPRNFF